MQRGVPAAVLVSDVAIGSDQGGRYVLIVNKDNVVEQRTRTGATHRRVARH
jgi:hypothetical protein